MKFEVFIKHAGFIELKEHFAARLRAALSLDDGSCSFEEGTIQYTPETGAWRLTVCADSRIHCKGILESAGFEFVQ